MAQQRNYQLKFILIHKCLAARIVLIAFLFSLFVVGCKERHTQDNQADKIFLGGDIITVDEDNPEAQAIAVYDGRIIAVGSETKVLKFRGSQTEVIDFQGNTLMPGLIDAHTHPILSAIMGQVVDVSGFSNNDLTSSTSPLSNIVSARSLILR